MQACHSTPHSSTKRRKKEIEQECGNGTDFTLIAKKIEIHHCHETTFECQNKVDSQEGRHD